MNENINFTDYASGIQLPYCSKLSINWKNGNGVTIFQHDVIVIFDVPLFPLSNLVTCPSYISISSLVLGLWQFSVFNFLQWAQNPEIRNTPVWFLPNTWRLRRVRVSDLARMSLIKNYWKLQNARVTVFIISELLREHQQGVKLPIPTQIKVKEKRDISVDMWSVAPLCKRLA